MYEILPNGRAKLDNDDTGLHAVVEVVSLDRTPENFSIQLRATAFENASDEQPMIDIRGQTVFTEFSFKPTKEQVEVLGVDFIIANCIKTIIGEPDTGALNLNAHAADSVSILQRVLAVRREKIITGRKVIASVNSQDHNKVLKDFAAIIPKEDQT